MKEEKTRAPPLLSEENLISTMDKNKIGTDATVSQHIKNITVRIFKEFFIYFGCRIVNIQ